MCCSVRKGIAILSFTNSLHYGDVIMSAVSSQITSVSPDGLRNRLFRRRSKKTSKFRVTGLCEGNSPVTGQFPSQRTSNAENVSIWWRHHGSSNLFLRLELCNTSRVAYRLLWKIQCVAHCALYFWYLIVMDINHLFEHEADLIFM